MPKRKNVQKIDGRVIKKNVPKKNRVGTRKSGKAASLMSTADLQAALERGGRSKNKIINVLRKRGVTV